MKPCKDYILPFSRFGVSQPENKKGVLAQHFYFGVYRLAKCQCWVRVEN